jgi:hypothetical protein
MRSESAEGFLFAMVLKIKRKISACRHDQTCDCVDNIPTLMRGPSREGIVQLNKLSLNIQVKKMKVE